MLHFALIQLEAFVISATSLIQMAKHTQLTEQQKIQIIGRVKHAGESKAHVSRVMKRTWKTVHECIKRYDDTGSIKNKPGRGRKRVMDDSVCALAYKLLTGGKFTGAQAVAAELARRGKTPNIVSRNTIISSVRDNCKKKEIPGITAANAVPKRKLTDEQKAARLQFCLANRHTDWWNVMFTDRCKFHHSYPAVKALKCAWRKMGEHTEFF
jgi:hypothetical protein